MITDILEGGYLRDRDRNRGGGKRRRSKHWKTEVCLKPSQVSEEDANIKITV